MIKYGASELLVALLREAVEQICSREGTSTEMKGRVTAAWLRIPELEVRKEFLLILRTLASPDKLKAADPAKWQAFVGMMKGLVLMYADLTGREEERTEREGRAAYHDFDGIARADVVDFPDTIDLAEALQETDPLRANYICHNILRDPRKKRTKTRHRAQRVFDATWHQARGVLLRQFVELGLQSDEVLFSLLWAGMHALVPTGLTRKQIAEMTGANYDRVARKKRAIDAYVHSVRSGNSLHAVRAIHLRIKSGTVTDKAENDRLKRAAKSTKAWIDAHALASVEESNSVDGRRQAAIQYCDAFANDATKDCPFWLVHSAQRIATLLNNTNA